MVAASDSDDDDDDAAPSSFFTLEEEKNDLPTGHFAGHSSVTVKATPHVAAPEDRPLAFAGSEQEIPEEPQTSAGSCSWIRKLLTIPQLNVFAIVGPMVGPSRPMGHNAYQYPDAQVNHCLFLTRMSF